MNEHKYYPKVLVISHNVFSLTSNMGKTLSEFFKGWPKDKIAQLYIHSEVPTNDLCTNYYRITDFEVINSIFKKKKTGTIFDEKSIQYNLINERIDVGLQAKIYERGRKRKPYMYLGRNLIWSSEKWKTPDLDKWINQFNPEIIFFATSDYQFIYSIVEYVSNKWGVPVVPYICDDYYIYNKFNLSPLYWINRIQIRNTIKKLLMKSSEAIVICEKIQQEYQKLFKAKFNIIMTGSTIEEVNEIKKVSSTAISYIGNLGYNRWKSLIDIGNVLKEISNENKRFVINVYSTEKRPEILKHMTIENGIDFKGAVNSKQVEKIIKDSFAIIHVESHDTDNKKKVMYSVSTKIADSLASGTCLLAYGPADVASIEYISKNRSGFVITEKDDLKKTIIELIEDEQKRNDCIKNALKISNKNHDSRKNSIIFRKILCKVIKEKE